MKLSDNFTYEEFIKSQTAERKGIDNEMPADHLENAIHLAETILQPVREHCGVTIITSGYRCPELNEAIGGSTSSQHCYGEAADIEVPGLSNHELFKWIKDNLQFDQLILEFYDPEDPSSGWVHVSKVKAPEVFFPLHDVESPDRGECLMALKRSGKTIYEPYDEDKV